jgi:hypothetical protein
VEPPDGRGSGRLSSRLARKGEASAPTLTHTKKKKPVGLDPGLLTAVGEPPPARKGGGGGSFSVVDRHVGSWPDSGGIAWLPALTSGRLPLPLPNLTRFALATGAGAHGSGVSPPPHPPPASAPAGVGGG